MPVAEHWITVSPERRHKIRLDQISQDVNEWTSQVQVRGDLFNDFNHRAWSQKKDITRWITGEQEYHASGFGFDIPAGSNWNYIDQTFTVHHDPDGTKTVSFTTHYGDTGEPAFDGPSANTVSLKLSTLGFPPDAPGQPIFSAVEHTGLTVSWSPTPADHGSSVITYKLRRWQSSGQTGTYKDSSANSLTRTVTGLTAGKIYTFAVQCQNKFGWSEWSPDNHITLLPGGWIRVGGIWQQGIPYVRHNGVWKPAIPYVRSGGLWKQSS